MKRNQYEYPKSSFLGLSKDTALIMDKVLNNKNVLKLLYYTTPDWKEQPDLTATQIKSMFETKQISNVPKIFINKEQKNYLRITFNSFTPNDENPYYRDSVIEIRILCHFEDWDLNDYELRPYRIAGEIDSMINGTHLSGIGEVQLLNAQADVYDEEFGGLTLTYLAIRGNEDKVNPLC